MIKAFSISWFAHSRFWGSLDFSWWSPLPLAPYPLPSLQMLEKARNPKDPFKTGEETQSMPSNNRNHYLGITGPAPGLHTCKAARLFEKRVAPHPSLGFTIHIGFASINTALARGKILASWSPHLPIVNHSLPPKSHTYLAWGSLPTNLQFASFPIDFPAMLTTIGSGY